MTAPLYSLAHRGLTADNVCADCGIPVSRGSSRCKRCSNVQIGRGSLVTVDLLYFLERSKKRGECWEWLGARNNDGYGTSGPARRVLGTAFVHRAIWVLRYGPVPDGLEIDHRCRNRACLRPAHLELVSHRANMRRAPHIKAQLLRTHCPRGHAYSNENVYVAPNDSRRHCRACMRLVDVARRDTRKPRDQSKRAGTVMRPRSAAKPDPQEVSASGLQLCPDDDFCLQCRAAAEFGAWDSYLRRGRTRYTHCRSCHRTHRASEVHCVKCHRTFSSHKALSHHQRSDVGCRDPATVVTADGRPVFAARHSADGITWTRTDHRLPPSKRLTARRADQNRTLTSRARRLVRENRSQPSPEGERNRSRRVLKKRPVRTKAKLQYRSSASPRH